MPVVERINHLMPEPFDVLDIEVVRGADGRPASAVFRARALSFDRPYRVSDDGVDWYTEEWRPSVFRKSLAQDAERGRRLPLYYNHVTTRVDPHAIALGGVTEFHEYDDRLEFTARFVGLEHPDVSRIAALLDQRVLRGVSIGARVYSNRNADTRVRIRTAARLDEISLVMAPAFDDAHVLDDAQLVEDRNAPVATPALDRWAERLAPLGITRKEQADASSTEEVAASI